MLLGRLLLICALLAVLPGGKAIAAASKWVGNQESKARLISATDAVGGLGELRFGLEIRLEPGWKTYWRSPGEGGLPPKLDWSKSDNIAIAEIAWPAPKRFQILGIDSVGYEEQVVYPIAIVPARPGEAVHARLTVDYLTCEEICIPQMAVLDLYLPAGEAVPALQAFYIDQARGQVPGAGMPGFEVAAASISTDGGKKWWLDLETTGALSKPDAFVEAADEAFAFGAPQRLGPTKLRLPVHYATTSPAELPGTALTITLTDNGRAIETKVEAVKATASTGLAGWIGILATALLGGLILNLMPCVLPVLSVKMIGLAKHGGGDSGRARASFLATAAGILVSFGVLAGGAIALKAGGVAVGWGIQFQEPLFIAFMTLVCILFAANLWGLFEIPLPAFLGKLGEGQAGSFTTGVFATLLATPCSAPFVGTAVAFALSRGSAETVSVFLAMGLGLALPYLAVAAWPRLATALPKPGRWMIWLRIVLGFALAATAAWLLTILLSLSGMVPAIALAALCAVLVVWLWQARAAFRLPGAALLIAAGIALPAALPSATPNATGELAIDKIWQPFSQDRLAFLVADGQTVFVDVTADWCITCKANKAAVLNRGEVSERLSGDEIVALKADWTRPDPAIQQYLASFGRYGIPFNAVYGPGAPAGIALPELLTEGAVLAAIKKAAEK